MISLTLQLNIDDNLFSKRAMKKIFTWTAVLCLALTACKQSKTTDQQAATFRQSQPSQQSQNTAPPLREGDRGRHPQSEGDSGRLSLDLLKQRVPRGTSEIMLTRTSYITSYNKNTRTPNWVAWTLTKDHTYGQNLRENERFEVVNGPGVQWLGNGFHYYRVYGARLDIDELDRLLGVKEQKAAACEWNEYDYKDDDNWGGSLMNGPQLEPIGTVWGWNQELLALRTALGRVLYIKQAALDALPGNRFAFTMRHAKGMRFIAVHNGLMCEALISPIDPEDAEKLNQAMLTIATMEPWTPYKEATAM